MKTNLEPWKNIKTNLNHWKPIKTEMEPWKTNLEPSKLTRSCRGWLWVVQVVTGNSQEEVMIFCDTQTDRHFIIIYISSIVTIISIIISISIIKILRVSAPQDRSCSCFQSLLLRACETQKMTFKVQNFFIFLETVRKRSWKNSQLNQRFNIQVC